MLGLSTEFLVFETSLREALLTEAKDNICAHFDRSIKLCILIAPDILKWPNKLSHVFNHLLQSNAHENKTKQCLQDSDTEVQTPLWFVLLNVPHCIAR